MEKLTFNHTFKTLSSKKWEISYTAKEALDLWDTFISDCENGYGWTVFEYRNELSIRTIIEEALQNDDIQQFQDYEEYKMSILELDKRFKEIVLNKDFFIGTYWWEKKLPKIGYGDFIKTLNEAYNIYDVHEIQ